MTSSDNRFIEFGKAISQCSELLVELVSLGGEEVYFDKTPAKFAELANLDIVLGNVADGYSASSLLMELSRTLSRQDTAKRLAPSVDEWLSQTDLRINQLNNALVENNNDGYVNRLNQVRELVYVMREGLTNEMSHIEFSINTKFGHVDSIKDKQSENQYLISRVSHLADKLMLLDYKRLRSMAGSNPDLLLLLPSRLHEAIERCRLSLINTLPRLKHLLWEFEKINKNTQLVWALHNHLRNQSIAYTHVPSDDELESLMLCSQQNIKEPITHPSICDDRYTDDLIDIVHTMKERGDEIEVTITPEKKDTEYSETDPNSIATIDNYLESKLLEMVGMAKKEKVSCYKFWLENIEGQTHPSGFMQWAHKTLEDIPGIRVTVVTDKTSVWVGNVNIYDFTLELSNAA
jgi:hypothetical protein